MSRIRSIHPGFFTDEGFVSVGVNARLFFIGLGNEADDKGIFEWKPITLKMRIFPADNFDTDQLLGELQAIGKIRRFEVDGKAYGAIRNFRRFQRPKSPNDVHPITVELLDFVGISEEDSCKVLGSNASIYENHQSQVDAFSPDGETHDVETVPFLPTGEISPQMEEGGGKGSISRKEPDGSSLSSSDVQCEQIVEAFNRVAKAFDLPSCRKITPKRRTACRARIRDHGLGPIIEAIERIPMSAFLRGKGGNASWNGANIEFLLRPDTVTKILEGQYDDKPRNPAHEGQHPRSERRTTRQTGERVAARFTEGSDRSLGVVPLLGSCGRDE